MCQWHFQCSIAAIEDTAKVDVPVITGGFAGQCGISFKIRLLGCVKVEDDTFPVTIHVFIWTSLVVAGCAIHLIPGNLTGERTLGLKWFRWGSLGISMAICLYRGLWVPNTGIPATWNFESQTNTFRSINSLMQPKPCSFSPFHWIPLFLLSQGTTCNKDECWTSWWGLFFLGFVGRDAR